MPGARSGGRAAASGQRGCAPCWDAGTKTRGERSCAAAALADRLTLFQRAPPPPPPVPPAPSGGRQWERRPGPFGAEVAVQHPPSRGLSWAPASLPLPYRSPILYPPSVSSFSWISSNTSIVPPTCPPPQSDAGESLFLPIIVPPAISKQ